MIVIIVGAICNAFSTEIAEVIAVSVVALSKSFAANVALVIAGIYVNANVMTLALVSANVFCAICVCALAALGANVLALVCRSVRFVIYYNLSESPLS